MKTSHGRNTIGDEKGMVLITALLLITVLVLLGSTGIMTTTTDMKISTNYKGSVMSLYDAEAGVHYTIGGIRNSVISLPTSGTSTPTLTAPTGFSFSGITLEPVPGSTNQYLITSIGNAANGAKKELKVVFKRSSLIPAGADGAVAMYGGGPQVEFKTGGAGSDLNVDGNDYPIPVNPSCNGNACRTTALPTGAKPGLYTPSEDPFLTGNFADHLGGGPPAKQIGGGSHTNAEWQDFVDMILSDSSLYQNTLGTRANPAVTVVPGGSMMNGTSNGAGILIVQDGGEFKMAGNSCFEGIVILLGNGTLTSTGTAIVYGSVVTISHTSKLVDAKGSTDLYYSSAALSNLANIGSLQTIHLTSWKDTAIN